jgi:hypothetical protein
MEGDGEGSEDDFELSGGGWIAGGPGGHMKGTVQYQV